MNKFGPGFLIVWLMFLLATIAYSGSTCASESEDANSKQPSVDESSQAASDTAGSDDESKKESSADNSNGKSKEASGKDGKGKKEPSDHQKILAAFGVYGDPEIQAYVSRIGQKVASFSDEPDRSYHFTVLNSEMINAMATKDGYIYVTRGMLAQLNSEAELATVLGHEIAHVTEKHHRRSQNSGNLIEALAAVATIVTQMPGLYELSRLYGGVLLKGYSREHELEADRVGIEYSARAGYPPDAMLNVIAMFKARDRMEILQAYEEKREPNVYHGFLSTHPDNEARSKQSIALMNEQYGYPAENPLRGEEAFLRKLNGLTIGKTHKVGVVRGNRFYYPKLGIKLAFPKKWRLEERPRGGVNMISHQSDALMKFSSGRMDNKLSPAEYLVDRKAFRFREGKDLTIGGMPAFIGIADKAGSDFGPRPVRVAVIYDKSRRRAYVFEGAGKHDLRKIANDSEFFTIIFSFDRMTKEDFVGVSVPKLQVVRAEQGTTMESLAKESPITNYPLEKLRVMNGLYPEGQPEAGQLIKIVD